MNEKISCLVLVDNKPEIATEEEIKEVLKTNDGDLEKLNDFKDVKVVWGYLAKIGDWFRYALLDMDKVLLLVDDKGEAYSYEHTGNYNPEYKNKLKVVGLMDEEAEIEATEGVF